MVSNCYVFFLWDGHDEHAGRTRFFLLNLGVALRRNTGMNDTACSAHCVGLLCCNVLERVGCASQACISVVQRRVTKQQPKKKLQYHAGSFVRARACAKRGPRGSTGFSEDGPRPIALFRCISHLLRKGGGGYLPTQSTRQAIGMGKGMKGTNNGGGT